MATTGRLTLASVARMQPGDVVWDADVKGFGARCRAGTVSYIFKTRVRGKQTWITIGKHGSPWTPEAARRKALALAAEAANGIDPAETRRVEKAKMLFTEAGAQFIAEHGPKLKIRTRDEYDRLLRTHLNPAFGHLRLEHITSGVIAKAHASWADTPRTANLALAVLSKLMTWASDHGLVPVGHNPCGKIKKYREGTRERYLTTSEIERLWHVLDEIDRVETEPVYATAAVRLLLLTGARLTEITTLRWSWVDLETATLWLPDSKTGKKAIRLNPQAVAILERLPRVGGNPHVIVGHRYGGHLVNLHKPWLRIRERAGIGDVRIHDLRHSFASIAINAGASLAMVGKLLGHSQPQTTARYAHLADDPLRKLNDQIGNAITGPAGVSIRSDEGAG